LDADVGFLSVACATAKSSYAVKAASGVSTKPLIFASKPLLRERFG